MFRNPQDEHVRRPLPPIGAERAARLAARNSLNLKTSQGGGGATDVWQNPGGSEHGCTPFRVCGLWSVGDEDGIEHDENCVHRQQNAALAACLGRGNPWSWMGSTWSGAGGSNNFGGGGTVSGWERDTMLDSVANRGGMGHRDPGETFTANMGSQRYQPQGHQTHHHNQQQQHQQQHQQQQHQQQQHHQPQHHHQQPQQPPQQQHHQPHHQPQLQSQHHQLPHQQAPPQMHQQVHPQLHRHPHPETAPMTQPPTYRAPSLLHRSNLGHVSTPDSGSTLFHELLRAQERTCSLAQRIHDLLPTDPLRRQFQHQLFNQQIQIEQQLCVVLEQKLDLVTKAMHVSPELAHSYYLFQPTSDWGGIGAALATGISPGNMGTNVPTGVRASTPLPSTDHADLSLDMSRLGMRSPEVTPAATSTPLQENRTCPSPGGPVSISVPGPSRVTMSQGTNTMSPPAHMGHLQSNCIPSTSNSASVAAPPSIQYNTVARCAAMEGNQCLVDTFREDLERS
ncbi:RNA polymerase II degradation factor 1-like [Drosophila ananassae]|uniref:RNA polymerase II degradation factor 1-like n=1 Tax=Drosophila ananassae TaxID=7217 RepID=UPI000177DF7D|nr:RNA polymerase II degradation factor 1-like [Drosophila ananassae]